MKRTPRTILFGLWIGILLGIAALWSILPINPQWWFANILLTVEWALGAFFYFMAWLTGEKKKIQEESK